MTSPNPQDRSLLPMTDKLMPTDAMKGPVMTGFDPSRLTDPDILEMAGRAVRDVRAIPAGYLVDPGAGSAMDRLQHSEPTAEQCCDMARRGGSYETLYTGSAIERVVIHVVRAALAIEARRAETVEQGSVNEGAGLQGNAQKGQS